MSKRVLWLSILGILIIVIVFIVFKVQQDKNALTIPDKDLDVGTNRLDEEFIQVFKDKEEILNEIAKELMKMDNRKEIFILMSDTAGPEFVRPGEEVLVLRENENFMKNVDAIYATGNYWRII